MGQHGNKRFSTLQHLQLHIHLQIYLRSAVTMLAWYMLSSPHQEAQHFSVVNTLLSIGSNLSLPLNNKFSYP
jgi:hypothetical protein